jgi:hypothetical protein
MQNRRPVTSFFSPLRLPLSFFLAAAVLFLAPHSFAEPSGDWHDEFDEICSKAGIAGDLGRDELESLLERVDKLMPLIEASDDPKKKVYIFRLKKCKNLFEYIIAVNEKS